MNDNNDPHGSEPLSVSVCGVRETQWPDCFFWGDRVSPLEPAHRPLNLPADRSARINRALVADDDAVAMSGGTGAGAIAAIRRRQTIERRAVNPEAMCECGHALSRHDPEDGTCDAPVADHPGVCPCGRVA